MVLRQVGVALEWRGTPFAVFEARDTCGQIHVSQTLDSTWFVGGDGRIRTGE